MLNANLYTLMKNRFADCLQKTVLETDTGHQYSYSDLDRITNDYAARLAELGLKPNDRVAVQVDKSPEALFFYLACLRSGLIYLPLNTAYRQAELDYFLEDAEPTLVLCRPAALATFQPLTAKHDVRHLLTLDSDGSGSWIEGIQTGNRELPIVKRESDDIAAILYTSGTTGRPKGAMISHGNLAANAAALVEIWGWQDDDVLLHALPLFHVHGLFVACHCVLLGGGSLLFLDKLDIDKILERLPRSTVMMGVPTYYTRLLQSPAFDRNCCRNMRLFISGSAPLLEQTFHDFKQRSGHTILERYGMTETGMNTSNPLDGDRIAGTVGLPLPGLTARIVDDQDRDQPRGKVGQLLVKGPNVFQGYWRKPDKTAEEFTADGYFRTGDLAKIHDSGYVAIVGRAKDLIISGGYNVYPKEVEGFIDDIDGVVESAVIGIPDPDFGEAVAAVVVTTSESDLDANGLIAMLKEQLAGFKVPKQVYIVDELPRNTMGKVQKNLLRQQYASRN